MTPIDAAETFDMTFSLGVFSTLTEKEKGLLKYVYTWGYYAGCEDRTAWHALENILGIATD